MTAVGISKEIKSNEKRVGLVPDAVARLTAEGIDVFVESGAGSASGFPDENYVRAGGSVVSSRQELYKKCGLIVKVKEPQKEEFLLLTPRHILFCFLHLASPEQCGLLEAIVKSKATAIGYETVIKDGGVPILKQMSLIAGGLAMIYAAYFKENRLPNQDRTVPGDLYERLQKLAAAYPAIPAISSEGKALIYGGGNAGFSAALTAKSLGWEVFVVEAAGGRRKWVAGKGINVLAPDEVTFEVMTAADVLIGCGHSAGERAQKVMTVADLEKISACHKKILMDVSIDQGGNFPDSLSAPYHSPLVYDRFGNLRFCVPNIPALCGTYASEKLSAETLPYIKALAEGQDPAFERMPELKAAVNVQDGRILLEAVRKAHQQ